jgi:mannose-6-phosphate isomerase-like protein (cupin superfamily)
VADYTKVNLKDDVEDQAPNFGLAPHIEARMARVPLELENCGISYQRLAPNFRLPFGHRHKRQEEVYVLVSGSARIKLDDEVVELRQWDAVRVPKDTMRGFEAGAEGAELIAVGAPNTGPGDADMEQGWWGD